MAEKVDSFTFTVEGVPVAKERPRKAKDGHFYTPQKTKDHEELIQQFWMANGKKFIEGAIGLLVVFYMPIPKSLSKKQRERVLSGEVPHTSKPDLDNLGKLIKDSMNECAYKDDSYVVAETFIKVYDLHARTEITISSMTRTINLEKEDD